jgi:hypothetical protein
LALSPLFFLLSHLTKMLMRPFYRVPGRLAFATAAFATARNNEKVKSPGTTVRIKTEATEKNIF